MTWTETCRWVSPQWAVCAFVGFYLACSAAELFQTPGPGATPTGESSSGYPGCHLLCSATAGLLRTEEEQRG